MEIFVDYMAAKTKSTQNIKNGIVTLGVFRRQLMDKVFLENMKTKLMEQKKTLLDSLADQSEDMKNLVKTVDDKYEKLLVEAIKQKVKYLVFGGDLLPKNCSDRYNEQKIFIEKFFDN